jgi:hypothetical protein
MENHGFAVDELVKAITENKQNNPVVLISSDYRSEGP